MAQAITLKLYGRADFVHIYTPFTSKDFQDAKPKYRVNIIMDPRTPKGKDSLARLDAAVKEICMSAWKKPTMTWTDPKRFCLRDGNANIREVKDDKTGEMKDVVREGYAGNKFLIATSLNAPIIKDSNGTTDLVATDNRPVAGDYCNFVVNLKDTDKGGRGLFAYLEVVQFITHGDPLGGGGRVKASDFLEDESQEAEDDEV